MHVAPAAAQAILQHRWPLNIRELEQALEGALVDAQAKGTSVLRGIDAG